MDTLILCEDPLLLLLGTHHEKKSCLILGPEEGDLLDINMRLDFKTV
jgi:hypothetical protein